MAWYWILLMLVGVQGLFLLVWWLINKQNGNQLLKALEGSATQRLKEEAEAERKKAETINHAYGQLTAKFKELVAWYTENREKISKEASDEFKAMAGDPQAVDDWLNGLTPVDDTIEQPGSTTAPTSADPEKP